MVTSTPLESNQLLALDVDGVLTDGGLWLDAEGNLSKRFDVRDGLGIHLLQQEGLHIAFHSGGLGGATEALARQLGIKHCLVGIKDKPSALSALQKQLGVNIAQTAFVGDDLNDLAVRPVVGLLFSPADACLSIRGVCDEVLQPRGGHGALRELVERILEVRGSWGRLHREGWKGGNDQPF